MKNLILIFTLFLSSVLFAQQDDKTVTLVTNGTGVTIEQATQNALRSAIEQAFGTFISSNTEILNDELVKDEIVSVANGNIQDYTVISEAEIPNVGFATSVKATVSVSKLTSFVESKGVIAEFKGGLLAINVKQQMLNEQNETVSIKNISNVCKEILDKSCDFEIIRGEPKQKENDNNLWAVPITINVMFNKNIEQFNQYFYNSIKGLSMSPDEVKQYEKLGKKTYKVVIGEANVGELMNDNSNIDEGYAKDIASVKTIASSNPNLWYKIIYGEEVVFESNDIELIESEFKEKRKQVGLISRGKLKIQYSVPPPNPIFHFRTLPTIYSIIDLIEYTKHSVSNFEITNGIDIITALRLVEDLDNIKLTNDGLNPIFNSRQPHRDKLNRRRTRNGPKGLFYQREEWAKTTKLQLYKPFLDNNPSKRYLYNGGRIKELTEFYNEKYDFLNLADIEIPSDNFGFEVNRYKKIIIEYYAVISLYDYVPSDNSVVSFTFNDIITLDDLNKITEYKITPKKSNIE
jgi:hypothetical protein